MPVCLLGCYLLRFLPYLEAGTQFQFNAGLKDYSSVVKPVATAIDILQCDKNCYLGCVLPTIKSLMANVQNKPTSLAAPLKTAILDGLHVRSDHLFRNEDFILAAVCHPKIKLSWIDDPVEKARCTHMLESVCDSMATDVQSDSENTQSMDEDHDQFFVLHHSSTSSASSQCMSYLSNSDRSLDMLSRYPKMKAVFIKYNTALPSMQCASGKALQCRFYYFEGYKSFTKFRLRILVILLFYFITASVRSC